MNFTPEQITKAKTAKSAEELLAIAKENGIELTSDEAAKFFADLKCEGEVADDELANVSGGGCGYYYYADVAGQGVLSNWAPICKNEYGLGRCEECGGFDTEIWRCTGYHSKK